MAIAKYKTLIGYKVADVLKKSCNNPNPELIESLLNVYVNNKANTIGLHLPLNLIQKQYKDVRIENFDVLSNAKLDKAIENISSCRDANNEQCVVFNLNNNLVMKELLDNKEYFQNIESPTSNKSKFKEKVIIEFSSPNVAKPFHFGNFRSTIIGNYLANLYKYLSYDVVRLTYLGDWGTQFGLLQVGLDQMSLSDEQIAQDPTNLLFKAYVIANKASESDPNILVRAKEIFNQMEQGKGENVLDKWKKIREFTTAELKEIYDRLGVRFHHYEWESNYPANNCQHALSQLQEKSLLHHDNGKVAFKLQNGGSVTMLKSDGSSLYLTRDVVAAIDRQKRFGFDRMLYVTDFSQKEHFSALKEILEAIDTDWSNKIQHVKFGRIRGMSTRKGEVVFLKDILEEAKTVMAEKQKASPTTKWDFVENTSDVLGISAVIVNDLRQRRMKDYNFSWDSALQMKGDSGVKLQYTHCRLVSLAENSKSVHLPDHCDPQLLQELEAVRLVQQIARFDDVIKLSFENQEPYIIVNYLFKLCNSINQAIKVLQVKHSSSHLASNRLLLFHYARIVLNRGMKIVGLKPLDRM